MSKSEIKEYKDKYPFKQRQEKALQMRNDNSSKFPVILLRSKMSKYTLPAHRYFLFRFVIDGNMTVGNFICAVRKYMWLKQTEGLYLYLQDTLPMLNVKISDLYEKFVDEDGFLYLVYTHQEDKGC